MPMLNWHALALAEPELAQAGRRLLGTDAVAIRFLATAGRDSRPHLSPVCPIFAAGRVYVSVPPATPKCRDLAAAGQYVLHAFLGPDNEEFAFSGRGIRVDDPDERAAVHAAIRFGSFDHSHPLFRLVIGSCHWTVWKAAGTPTTRKHVRRWRAPAGD